MSDFRLDVKGDMKAVLKDMRRVEDKLSKRVAASALNKTMMQSRTQVVSEVSKQVGVPAKPIRARVPFGKRDRANARRPVAILRGRLQKLPVTSAITPKQRAALERFIGRGNRKKGTYAAKRLWERAFITRINQRGKVHIFRRKGASRLPIEKVGIEVGGHIDQSAKKYVNRLGPRLFKKLFEREMQFRLSRP